MNTQTLSHEEIATITRRARSGVMSVVETDLPARVRRHHRRVGIAVAVSALAAVALTAGTVAVIQASHDQRTYSVQCYSQASTSSSFTTTVEGEATNSLTGQKAVRPVAEPLSVCGEMWRMGLVGQKPAPGQDPNTANYPVPQLVACTLSDGVGAAFPREGSIENQTDFCDALGLTPWPN